MDIYMFILMVKMVNVSLYNLLLLFGITNLRLFHLLLLICSIIVILGFLFASSSKYGCRQFKVRQSKSFPVHCLDFVYYKNELPWIVPEFNDFASVEFIPKKYIKYPKILKDTWPDLFIDKIGVTKLPF